MRWAKITFCSLAIAALTAAVTAGFASAQEQAPAVVEEIAPAPMALPPCPVALPLCPPAPPEEPGKPVPPTLPFEDPPIKPTLCDFLKAKPVAKEQAVRRTDPLLRPPFAGQPVETPKGLAAGIRAIELDAPNRILAAQYLGTVDCVTYPQAKEMLIQMMQEDPQEEVRYEAVMALRLMLTHGYVAEEDGCECEACCNRREIVEQSQEHAKKAKKKAPKKHPELCEVLMLPCKIIKAPHKALKAKKEEKKFGPIECRRYDWCRGCCGARALQALSKVAYDKDEFGCPMEPSARIRQAAIDGLCLCPCEPVQYVIPTYEPVPPAPEKGEQVPTELPKEQVPPTVPPSETTSARRSQVQPVVLTPRAVPGLAALNGYCIVNLQMKQFVPAKPEFSTEYAGHTYCFASAEARAEFERFPESYAPAYAGADPVEKIDRQHSVEGKFLRQHEGRFYLFVTKENWEAFKRAPGRYVPSEVDTVSGPN